MSSRGCVSIRNIKPLNSDNNKVIKMFNYSELLSCPHENTTYNTLKKIVHSVTIMACSLSYCLHTA